MNYAGMIDHTLLKPEATKEQIKKLLELGFIELKNDTTSNTVEE